MADIIRHAKARDVAALKLARKVIRTRPATKAEQREAGDANAHVVSFKTCSGTFSATFTGGLASDQTVIARALAGDWGRKPAEVVAAISATLGADDETLSRIASVMMTARTICGRGNCADCACGFAPLFAAPVVNAAEVRESAADALAIVPDRPVSESHKSVGAKIELVAQMRSKLRGAAHGGN